MPRKPEYKPLLYTTTIRNPERFKDFMHILKRFNGRILNNKTVELFERELFKVGLYRPMKRPETVQDKWKSTKNGELASKPLTDEETKDVYQQNDPQVNKSIKGHQEAGFPKGWPSRFDTQFKLMKVLGFVYYEWGKPINFSQTGNYLADTVSIEIDSGAISREIVNPQNEQIAFMQAFAKNNNIPFSRLIPLLDFCAVSIAADIVPVVDENRILAFHGLKLLNTNPSIGLKSIIDICGLNGRELSMSDIVFKIGPRINASGRMENGKLSVDLLVERDYSSALRMARHINEYNEQRKDIDKQMTEEANGIVSRLESMKHNSSIVLYDEGWKKGVIGIVASRLTEIYFRPTIVLTRDGDMATGSARSVTGFDIYSAIKSCRDLLLNFGGHTYAAGLTLKWDKVREFRDRFQHYVEEHISPQQTEPMLNIDAEIDFKDITKHLQADLKRFSPFGPCNQKPIFCTNRVYDYGTSKVVGREQEHIKLELVDSKSSTVLNGIAFGQSAAARYIKSKRSFDIAFTIEENIFKKNQVQLQIEDIRPNEG